MRLPAGALKLERARADYLGMSNPLEQFTILSLTQRWVLLEGAWYREAWVLDAAGVRRFVAILDELV